jgi:hypothetical protein
VRHKDVYRCSSSPARRSSSSPSMRWLQWGGAEREEQAPRRDLVTCWSAQGLGRASSSSSFPCGRRQTPLLWSSERELRRGVAAPVEQKLEPSIGAGGSRQQAALLGRRGRGGGEQRPASRSARPGRYKLPARYCRYGRGRLHCHGALRVDARATTKLLSLARGARVEKAVREARRHRRCSDRVPLIHTTPSHCICGSGESLDLVRYQLI